MKRVWGCVTLVYRILLGRAAPAVLLRQVTAETGVLLEVNARWELLEVRNLSYSVISRIFTRKDGAKEVLRRSGKAGGRGIVQHLQAYKFLNESQ